jgi:hypothetical protein
MFRILLMVTLVAGLSSPAYANPTVLDDATGAVAKLNPINIALNGLIGEAADAGNSVLQQRLQQLQGIVQLAIYELNEAAKQRIDQIDARTRDQIADVNKIVQMDLLQFDSLVGKHIKDINSDMLQRIDQLNFGIANTIASVQILNTIPLIRTDSSGTGLTTFKQQGNLTKMYIVGSGFMKIGQKPTAYISGSSVKADRSTLWGLSEDGISVDVENASMGLLELSIPNAIIPDDYGPASFSLKLKIGEGSNWIFFHKYSSQSVPLHVCGKLPKLSAKLTVWASGKHYIRDRRPMRDLHAAVRSGNNNSSDKICLPPSPPLGWEFDLSYPDYGIVYGGENHNNYHVIVLPGPGNPCLGAYVEGGDGDAHLNIQGVQMKLIQLADAGECTPKWSSEPLTLGYGALQQTNINDRIVAAKGGECTEARAREIPTAHVSVSILDANNKIIETRDLLQDTEVSVLKGAGKFIFHNTGLLDMELDPTCNWGPIPATQN